MKYDCIIPAAGLSSRMGDWKLMLKYKGKTILDHVLENASENVGKIIISGGYRFDELNKNITPSDQIEIIQNFNYEKGMITSVQAALPLVKTDKFFVVLSDMPLVPSEIFLQMSQINFSNALFPVYNGKRGHPVLIDSSLKSAISQFPDTGRMKDLLNSFDVSEFNVNTEGILLDIDTVMDYRKLIEE